MRALRLSSLLVIGLWFAAVQVCVAQQEIKFPEKSPLVSFRMPEGWFLDQESTSGPTILDGHDSATIMFRIRLLKETYSEADFKQKMPNLLKANLSSFGVDADSQNLGSIKTANRLLGDKIQAVYSEVKVKSTVLDEPYVVRSVGFTVNGQPMLVIFGAEESARNAGPDFDKILGSLKPVQ